MANIGKKFHPTKNATKVWSKEDVEKFGVNPYSNLIRSILRKEIQIDSVDVGNEVNKKYDVCYVEHRYTIKLFPASARYLASLGSDATMLFVYLGTKLLDNLNMTKVNNVDDMYKHCDFLDKASIAVEKAKSKGKVFSDEEGAIRKFAMRYANDAFNALLDADIIMKSQVKGYYWVNPKIMMKGSAEKIPLSHNEYNNKELIVLKKGSKYEYSGIIIKKVNDDFLVMDGTGSLFACLPDATDYIDTLT